ncbi:hypothetical protein P692DRAFT_201064708 [Suillus brevipes Sb2]|nr:hypothetical protein P692DRAFT_201064708 [Suillus brevipes Sb2]
MFLPGSAMTSPYTLLTRHSFTFVPESPLLDLLSAPEAEIPQFPVSSSRKTRTAVAQRMSILEVIAVCHINHCLEKDVPSTYSKIF